MFHVTSLSSLNSGFGFITFKDSDSVQAVLDMHNKEPIVIDEKTVRVRLCVCMCVYACRCVCVCVCVCVCASMCPSMCVYLPVCLACLYYQP